MAESKEELKSFLKKVKGEWKSWLKTQHSKKDHGVQFHHFMTNRRGKVEVVGFIFLGSKITADSDCRHEIKRHLLLGRKGMTNLDSILKSRHHFTDKGQYRQSNGFSSSHVQIWESENESRSVVSDSFRSHGL